MKIKEKRNVAEGFMGEHTQVRVRSLSDSEPIPADAEQVPDETTEYDWKVDA